MSTLHAALTGLLAAKDETGERTVHVDTIRDALSRHPAQEAGEVRLSEKEREALRGLGQGQVPAAVERILAARLAEATQPAGETRVEWGVRHRDGWYSGPGDRDRLLEMVADPELPGAAALVSRTVTSFPDVVGEWRSWRAMSDRDVEDDA